MKFVLAVSATAMACCALACSGPGAQASMSEATVFGYFGALIHAAILTGSLFAWLIFRGSFGFVAPLLGMFVVHPAWMMSAYHGDCGGSRVTTTIAFEAIAGLIFVAQLVAASRHRTSMR